MKVLVVGASGATGRLLVKELLARGLSVLAIVRSAQRFSQAVGNHDRLSVLEAAVLDLSQEQLEQCVGGCQAVASCLGHTLSFKGVYGSPRRLVAETTRRLCEAMKANPAERPAKFVLMNSTGCRNHDIGETVSLPERCVVGLIRLLVPPHRDNELASAYLRREVGQGDEGLEWVVVRPDGLVDAERVSKYEIHPSPIRSAIFDSGKTSRINVAHFMASLLCEQSLWETWQGRTPVVYNVASGEAGAG
ncbi:SDR family oxidoreductase [Pelagicoccus enzymogenes]|uniref:NAD(P)-dependent oxidoreductase n=1 Tax=Pelagicoccus enzymogenes TaxID=2773457 RepID=UPI00280D509E|nr:SDR family oxidoreductase [Pelagicoccus enzymogenes]MDQ8197456.1 SDR family oxidoreductase [Pelagicoccus enzymogenes]